MADYELVRVSRQLVDELLTDESPPVIVVGLERHDDETCEMILRRVDVPEELSRYRAALEATRDALADPNALDEAIDSPANQAFAIINHALAASPRKARR